MKLLIDTHSWLWLLDSPHRLGEQALQLLRHPSHEIYFSAASAWELAIKFRLGKLRLPEPPHTFVPARLAQNAMTELPIALVHALAVDTLPMHHHDPFDRLLIVQAQIERLPLMTADPAFKSYDVELIFVP